MELASLARGHSELPGYQIYLVDTRNALRNTCEHLGEDVCPRFPLFLCSTLAIVGLAGVAAKTMVTTTISGAFGAVTSVILAKFDKHYWDSGAANNGILAGLVGITAGCSTCEPEGAMVIGVISGFVYTFASRALIYFHVRVWTGR